MHNEELHDLYSSPNIIRMIQPRMGEKKGMKLHGRSAYKVLVKKSEAKRALGRLKCR
jgi:hypothetical protein